MRPLILKELRNLSPLLPLFLLFFCADVIFQPLSKPLDELTWYELHSGLKTDSVEPFLLYAMGLILGFSLFAREFEERTIEFLQTLPVTRLQIFLAKWSAASSVIVLISGLRELSYWALQLPNVASLGQQFDLFTALKVMLLSVITGSLGLAHGLLFSFGRQFGLLALAFLGWGLGQLKELLPELSYLDPLSVAEPSYFGSTLLMPWKTIGVHLLLAVFCLFCAQYLWSARGQQGTRLMMVGFKKWSKTVGCLTTLACVVLFVLWVATSEDSEDEPKEGGVQYPSYATARLATEHYNFTFPVSLRQRALKLAARADEIYGHDLSMLGNPDREAPIIADLTDVSGEHLGIASTEKLRMDIAQNEEPELLEHVLSHETSHVLCRRLSGRRGKDYSNALAFFNEGTAEYVAFSLVKSSRDLRGARRQAVAMKMRHELTFAQVADAGAMAKRFEGSVDYTLGELWAAALVECYGEQALAKVWKSVGREGGPKDLDTLEFWRDTLQAAGMSFEVVRSTWLAKLKRLEEEEAEFLQALPKVRGRAKRSGDKVMITGGCDREWPPDFVRLVVRIRAEHSEESRVLETLTDFTPERFEVQVPRSYGRTFDYQFGILFSDDAYPFWEEWKSAKNL